MKRLHFGSFYGIHEGWLNTDVTPHLYVARLPGLAWLLHRLGKMTDARYEEHRKGMFRRVTYLNVIKPWPFADGRFEAIYSSHVLEHLTLRGARTCIAEAYRCLKPGGVLRILVPDLDDHVSEFRSESAMAWAINFFEANEVSEKNIHHFMYNFSSLSELMRECGFPIVERCDYRVGRCPDVALLDNRPGSLIVEAVKS